MCIKHVNFLVEKKNNRCSVQAKAFPRGHAPRPARALIGGGLGDLRHQQGFHARAGRKRVLLAKPWGRGG